MNKLLLPVAAGLFACIVVTEHTSAQTPKKIEWQHLSSTNGDLPAPGTSTQQTGSLVADIDNDGVKDFVLSFRKVAPALVGYRRAAKGWDRFVIEPQYLTVEAGGAAFDIDGDGDLDLVFGNDYQGTEVWWWENPAPNFDPATSWKRHVIKRGGGRQHHDQIFGDFKGTGKAQLAFWNQGVKTLFLAEIPSDPRRADSWPLTAIFNGNAGEGATAGAALYAEGIDAADIDSDGKTDLLAGNYWFKHEGGNRFTPIKVGTIGGRIRAGKLIPGKYLQIVIAPGDGVGPLKWYECTGNPANSANWVGHDLAGRDMIHGHTLDLGDVDGDGHLDIFAAEMAKWTENRPDPNNPKAEAWIFFGDGNGHFRKETVTTGHGWHEGRLADLDGDGDLDLLNKPYNWEAPRIDVWLNNGTNSRGGGGNGGGAGASVKPPSSIVPEIPFRHVVIDRDNPMQPHCKTVGDIDGDGFPDALAASAFGQGLFWYAYPNWIKHRIDTGSFTTDMQVGDIDGDGDLDVVIPKEGVGLVWYENPRPQGNPVTTPWKRHQIDSEGAHDLELGDVDADGRLDVVVRHGKTRVFLQTSPDKWSKINIPTGGRGGTALGDLDGDGDLDIAQNGYWLEAPADKLNGAWTRHEIASGWPDDCGVYIVDLNKDGKPDVLLAPAETNGRLSWFETKDPKNGPWIEHVIDDRVAYIHTFKTVDVDHDGNLDVVASEMEQSPEKRIMIYFNQGAGIKWRMQVVGRSGSHNLRVADLGNDGDIDIIGANHGNYGGATPIEIWENVSAKPAPTLSLDHWERRVIDPAKPWRAVFIAAADLDGDGRKDIVTGGWWYQNPGAAGQAWARHDLGAPLNNMAAVYDFDGDGHFDVLGTTGKGSDASSQFVWARNDGRGGFTILTNIAKADGDFLQGVAVAQYAYRRIEVALSWHHAGHGIQMLTVPQNPVLNPWSWRKICDVSQDEQLSAGHIDRDARLDLLLGTKWLSREGNAWKLHTLNPTAGDPDRNRLADMNGDGRLDAIVGFEAINVPGKLAWYEQPANPSDTWAEHVIATVVGPMSMDVGDIDRDGDLDVVVGEHNYKEPATAKLHIFENVDGKGTHWKDHVISTGDEHHDGAILVDIDNDGDLDVVSVGWSHGKVLLYENKAL